MRRLHHILYILITIAIFSLAGGIWGNHLHSSSTISQDLIALLKTHQTIFTLVQENYAEKVDQDKVINASIQGMLEELDPHSNYYDAKSFQRYNEQLQGDSYCGIGIRLAIINNKPTVRSLFQGTPASRLGLRWGDIIVKIQGESTSGLSQEEVAHKLKGPKGSKLELTIQRDGFQQLLNYSFERTEIPQHSIPYSFLLHSKIGYIKISKFTETTKDEFNTSLKKIGNNLDGLILDLRNNPGGILQSSIAIAEKFLKAGQDIVITNGRTAGANHRYTAKSQTIEANYPLLILLNKDSASASEVLAAAIQDHDRGLIVGENSFGKGLVQSIIPLKSGSGLTLTTAKYYTPSGRSIQRNYSPNSLYEYFLHRNPISTQTQIIYTDNGREIFGGDGIAPDIKVEAHKTDNFQTQTLNQAIFFNFVRTYNLAHPKADIAFEITESILMEFRNSLNNCSFFFNEKDFQTNLNFIKEQIKYEYFLSHFGSEEAYKVSLGKDPYILKAMESIPQAKSLLLEQNKKPLHICKK